jgi:hypothetical protein
VGQSVRQSGTGPAYVRLHPSRGRYVGTGRRGKGRAFSVSAASYDATSAGAFEHEVNAVGPGFVFVVGEFAVGIALGEFGGGLPGGTLH